MINTTSI